MNKYLIIIKVDREERPDVDKIYMTAVAMTALGGWGAERFSGAGFKAHLWRHLFSAAGQMGTASLERCSHPNRRILAKARRSEENAGCRFEHHRIAQEIPPSLA